MELPESIDLGERAFQQRPELKLHLGYACFLALARAPWSELVVDYSAGRRPMKQGFLLAVSWLLSKRVKAWTERRRVGIIFPPGIGGYLANLAVVLAGRVPVNLNFTLGQSSSEACLRRAEIDCVLTTARVQEKIVSFPWAEVKVVDLLVVIRTLPKLKFLALLSSLYVLPALVVARVMGVPNKVEFEEAGLLFTSGSSGEPKGVVLSHRNILANCAQIDASGLLSRGQKMVANLPIFHSFGFTVTLWYPLLRGIPVVTVPSPLDIKKTAEAIAAEQATVLVGTPTFLKPYLKRVDPGQLKSLRYVAAGAEKTPPGFAAEWKTVFGSTYLEGYGLTETSPVVSLNITSVPSGVGYLDGCGDGIRSGSVGRLLPGLCAQVLHPETREPLALDATGLIALKGPNIFEGYLNDPERTAEVKVGDWFLTGDLGRFDADGFLYIEGRLSRFSKIGGEMVPHGPIEAALIAIYNFGDSEQPMLAIAGRPDAAKGEVLVLLTVLDLELVDVRACLAEAGFSNLWMPKEIMQVAEIPVLATGKLDLKAIQQLAINQY